MCKTFRNEVRKSVEGFYKNNDKAHDIHHADEVCNLAIELNEISGYGIDEKLIMAAAYFHDIYSAYRVTHHTEAHKYVLSVPNVLKGTFDQEEIGMIAKACLEHRDSWTGGFSTKLSEIISMADRGAPNAIPLLRRSFIYGKSKLKLSDHDARLEAIEHIRRKYSERAFAKYTTYYKEYFEEELERFHYLIESITPLELKEAGL